MQGARTNTKIKGGEKRTVMKAERGKIPLLLLLLLLLLTQAGGARAAEGGSELFVSHAHGQRCGSKIADAQVASLAQCAALCAQEATCSGFSLGARAPEDGASRRRACQPAATLSPCHNDPVFNVYVPFVSEEEATTQQQTTTASVTTTSTVRTTAAPGATAEAAGTTSTAPAPSPSGGGTTSTAPAPAPSAGGTPTGTPSATTEGPTITTTTTTTRTPSTTTEGYTMANAVTGVIANDSGLLVNLTFEELPFTHAEAVVTSEVCDRSNGYVVTDVDVQLTSWICRQLFSTLTVSGCSFVNATGNEAHCPEGRVVVLLGVRDSIDEIECCDVYYV